jgi:hypothetical protein
MELKIKTAYKLEGLKYFEDQIKGIKSSSAKTEFREAMKKWAVEYRRYLQKRFEFNRDNQWGWPRLSEVTKREKKNHGFSTRPLWLTQTLWRALTPEYQRLPGQYQRMIKRGISVGIGGRGSHPGVPWKPETSGNTVKRIVQMHAAGVGPKRVKRQIVFPPNRELKDKLNTILKNHANEVAKNANSKR